MIGRASSDFWRAYQSLPVEIRRLARQKFLVWRSNPFHPSLQFKELRPGLWSVRINRSYRTLGIREQDDVLWFWIGSHAEYDRLIR